MSDTIITALITGAVTLMGVLISNSKSQAVTDTKIEELTREVRAHNGHQERIALLEAEDKRLNERIKALENRAS